MLRIRQLSGNDVEFAMGLTSAAGWNQLPADWHRWRALEPNGCFVAKDEDVPTGTVVACRFGEVGWIAMMLVESSVRRRGIGQALMLQAIEYLEKQGATSIRLDATPMGQPLYERLGFVADFSLTRHAGIVMPVAASRPANSPWRTQLIASDSSPERFQALCRLDQLASGNDRRKLLTAMLNERPAISVWDGDSLQAWTWHRPGSSAAQLGPCIGEPRSANELLHSRLQEHVGQRVYVDIPAAHVETALIAGNYGLQPQRALVRMTRGVRVAEQLELLRASFGPELG